MKNSKYYFRFGSVLIISMFISVCLFAQHNNRDQRNRNNNHYNNSRSYVSWNFIPRYNYRPYYRNSYHAYSPVYRSPMASVHFGPAFGFRVNVLPFGYNRIYVGSVPYYYNEGVYYRSYNNEYEVVSPPLDATVKHLPSNARVTVIDGEKYYQLGDTFYQEEISANNELSYRVVGTDGVLNTENGDAAFNNNDYIEQPAIGNRYNDLPTGCKVEVINQHKYFVSASGVYYQEVIEGNKLKYEVTSVQ